MPKIIPIRDLKDTSDVLNLCEEVAEPIFVTKNGYGAMVIMSMETYEEREKMFRHRDAIYAAELSRLSGEPVCSQSELDARMEELFNAAEG